MAEETPLETSEALTHSQMACLKLVVQGMTSKEIARELGLSPATVDTYLRRAIALSGTDNRREAARYFLDPKRSQELRSQPRAVADSANSPMLHPSRGKTANAQERWFSLPPIGGEANELNWSERHYAIFKIGAFAISVTAGITLVTAGILWVFA